MRIRIREAILLVICFAPILCYSQKSALYPDSIRLKQVSIGINGMGSINNLKTLDYAYNVSYKQEETKRVALRAGLNFNIWYDKERNLYKASEFSVMPYFGIEPYFTTKSKRLKMYCGADLGMSYYRSFGESYQNPVWFREANSYGFLVAPFLGIEIRPDPRIAISLEFSRLWSYGWERSQSTNPSSPIDTKHEIYRSGFHRPFGVNLSFNIYKEN